MIGVSALITLSIFGASPPPFDVQQYSAESGNAALYVLPGSSAESPNIAILDDSTVTIYREGQLRAKSTTTIPANTLLFDLYDTDKDSIPELFVLTPNEVRHFPEPGNQTTVRLFALNEPLPWIVDQPFLHPLIFHYNNVRLVAIPYQDNITLRNFDGKTISVLPKLLSDIHSLFTIPIEPNQIAPEGSFEIRVDTLLTTAISVPQELRPTSSTKPFAPISPRQLRDTEQLELDQWPSFPLTKSSDKITKVIYASYAPEHIHTIIRIRKELPRNIPGAIEPFRYSTKRIYPGTIGISKAGLPDFNNDGFHDIVLWKVPMPGNSLSSLMGSLQSQTWPIEITTHLYDPEKGLYESRPRNRIKTTVALQYILTRQSESPLRNLSFADLNNDGKADITFSPRPDSIAAWLYDEDLNTQPDFASEFNDELSLITLNRAEAPNQQQSIMLRGDRSIYRIHIPSEDPR